MRTMSLHAAVFLLLGVLAGVCDNAASQEEELANVSVSAYQVIWEPVAEDAGLALSISKPDGEVFQETFPPGFAAYIDLTDTSNHFTDGVYTWELRAVVADRPKPRGDEAATNLQTTTKTGPEASLVQSGYFTVVQGVIVDPNEIEEDNAASAISAKEAVLPKDIPHYDDVIVVGSLCVGTDCANGETFGFDTIKLKENNLRIFFDDTSSLAGFPANDWRIIANDSASGGGSYFAIEDSTGAKTPLTIEAGAPNSSLYVDDYGKVGLKTATPAVELHMVDGDTPTVRLDQDASSGWTPQVWDVAGNESNFFIRDTTNGSKLPFRIQPGAPTNSLCVKSDGKIGIGTWSPAYTMVIERTGDNAAIVAQRTDGAANYMNATTAYANFGSVTNHPLRLMVNSTWRARINTDGSLDMSNGASCTAGGVWTNASSKELKENVQNLTADEAAKALTDLNPVKFNYKADKAEKHVGFVAEDAPDLVATKDRKGMSPMDVTAVLTKVVQEQQKTIAELARRIQELEKAARR